MLFPSNGKPETVKERIIYILGQDWPLSAKKIYNKIKKDKQVSYQAVHKSLKELLDENVVEKKNKKYHISMEWLENTENFFEAVRDNYLHHKPFYLEGVDEFKQEGDTQTFIFNSLGDAETYRKKLQWEYISKTENKPPYCGQSSHLKSPVVYSEKSLSILDLIRRTKTPCYITVRGNTKIDDWCASYYRNEFVGVKTGVGCAHDCEIMVIGDIITQLYLPEKIQKKMDEFYSQSEDISDINIQEFYNEIYKDKAKVKFMVYKNPEFARQIRNQILSHFEEDSELAVFDIDGTLVKGILFYDFAEFLLRHEKFDKEKFKEMKKILEKYEKGEIDYDNFAVSAVKNYSLGLKGQSKSEIDKLAGKFSENINFFEYSMDLFQIINKQKKTLAITASPKMLFNVLKKYLDFDNFIATELEVKGGKYTGRVKNNLALDDAKRRGFENYVKKNNVSLKKSIGVGDTHHDATFLERVQSPIAINPNTELKNIAQEKGWVVAKKDNILKKTRKLISSN